MLVELYAQEILDGNITLDDVPLKLREAVRVKVEEKSRK